MIPIAESVLRKHLVEKLQSGKDSTEDKAKAINDAMIEFAKLHVEEALKQASKKANYNFKNSPCSGLERNSIINAYPLTNIK